MAIFTPTCTVLPHGVPHEHWCEHLDVNSLFCITYSSRARRVKATQASSRCHIQSSQSIIHMAMTSRPAAGIFSCIAAIVDFTQSPLTDDSVTQSLNILSNWLPTYKHTCFTITGMTSTCRSYYRHSTEEAKHPPFRSSTENMTPRQRTNGDSE